MEIKPRTLEDYRNCIRLYVTPRIGNMRLQAIRPTTLTKLCRTCPRPVARTGRGLAAAITTCSAVLRKAFRTPWRSTSFSTATPSTAPSVRERITPNPEPSGPDSDSAPSSPWPPSAGSSPSSTRRLHGRPSRWLLNLRWPGEDLEGKQITITGSATAMIKGERMKAPPEVADPESSASTRRRSRPCESTASVRPPINSRQERTAQYG